MSANAGGTRSSPEENLTGDAVRVHHGAAEPKKIRGTKLFASASNEELVKTSREDINALIVFGGVFSIFITAFFIRSYQKLKETVLVWFFSEPYIFTRHTTSFTSTRIARHDAKIHKLW
ncbi:hypothetical protein VNI00_010809 [Paramarasmius palmivorus]|uniref:DUF6535 domain-containing protein n=1 Tax=Paramarasmius palmivorus TaxID=297713 RepID=A0AAW0CFZ7_9AGAR